MSFQLSYGDWKKIFPKAPAEIIDAFFSDTHWLNTSGITKTKIRLAYTLANVEHECAGFTVPNLTENINYSAKRISEVWPNRFSSAEKVEAKFGKEKGWQKKAFDEIYGNRMGNKKGTDDGSRFIGRGGPQITGRGGYLEVGKLCGLDLVNYPELATKAVHQPAILASFFIWKKLAKFADNEDFHGFVKAWNGGTNGLASRISHLNGNNDVIDRLKTVPKIYTALTKSLAYKVSYNKDPLEAKKVSDFSRRLVEICNKEYALFKNGTLKEYEDPVYKRVGTYWSELSKTKRYEAWAGYNGRSGVKFSKEGNVVSNNNQPWSAAFISFVMREAGADLNFSYSPSHSVYIIKAIEASKKPNSNSPFIARRHKLYSPKVGDIIACERQPSIDPNFDTYPAYVANKKYEAHCDVVTEAYDDYLITIGGNVSNSVSKKKWPLDNNKFIGNYDPKDKNAGVICVIENRL